MPAADQAIEMSVREKSLPLNSSGSQIYRTGFTTDINELDVIYGGEKRLFKSVREIIEKYDPPAVFVYQTCVTELIGDDIEAVCKRASEKFGKPVPTPS